MVGFATAIKTGNPRPFQGTLSDQIETTSCQGLSGPFVARCGHSDGRAGCAEKPASPLVDLRELSDFRFLNSQIFTVFVEFLESGIENSSEFGIVLTAPPVIYSEVSL